MACLHFHFRRWWQHFRRMPTGNSVVIWDRSTAKFVEMTEWMKSEQATGLYVCDSEWPPGKKACHISEIGMRYLFSDEQTAFVFKMRFG